MKFLFLFMCLLFCITTSVLAAPTATLNSNVTGNEIEYSLTGTTVGTTCVSMETYNQWAIHTDIDNTIVYDLENSLTNTASSCNAQTKCDDIDALTVDLNADKSFYVLRNQPWFCLTIDTCTSCSYTITIRGSKP